MNCLPQIPVITWLWALLEYELYSDEEEQSVENMIINRSWTYEKIQ